jgi:Ala-tRNA(Pro) deacylase
MTLQEKIIVTLDDQKISYEVYEHEPVYTNPAMAEALGVSESETVKSLVLMTKENKMIVLVLPGNKKVNWKQAAAAAKTKKVSFAKPESVSQAQRQEKYHLPNPRLSARRLVAKWGACRPSAT